MGLAFAEGRPPSLTESELAQFDEWLSQQGSASRFPGAPTRYPFLVSGGRQDFPHFWWYSLLAAPFVAAAEPIGVHPLTAFTLLNVVLLGAALLIVAHRTNPPVALLLLASPILWFTNKPQPEVLIFAVMAVALAESLHGRFLTGALALAVGAAQNPSLIPGVALFLARAVWRAPATWFRGSWLALGVIAALCAAPSLYNWWRTEAWHVFLGGSRGLRLPHLSEYIAPLIDPDLGLIPWLPLSCLLSASGLSVLWLVRRRPAGEPLFLLDTTLLTGLLLALLLAAFTAAIHLNAGGTRHVARYAVWIIPVLIPGLVALGSRRRFAPVVLWGTAIVSFPLYATYFSPSRSEVYLSASPQSAWLYSRLPGWYTSVPEVFYDRRSGLDSLHSSGVGSAATSDCALVLLSASSPATQCPLSPDEQNTARALFGAGHPAAWISRAGFAGRRGVWPEDRVAQSPDPRDSLQDVGGTPLHQCNCTVAGNVDYLRSVPGGIVALGWGLVNGRPWSTASIAMNDGTAVSLTRTSRPDLVTVFGTPDAARGGFQAILPITAIGPHLRFGTFCPTAVRLVTPEGGAYTEFMVSDESCRAAWVR